MANLVVVMGVAGSGKSTIGRLLATALDVPFCDADDLHPAANTERMRQGLPLDDEHRWPWLRAVHERLAAAARAGQGLVVACSALKTSYRQRLVGSLGSVPFVLLHAPREVLATRLQQRRGHFFPATLLDSQWSTLEPLTEKEGFSVDAAQPVHEVLAQILNALATRR
jgi:gluconokinase